MTGSRGPRSEKEPTGDAATPPAGAPAPELPDGYDPRTVAWWAGILALPHSGEFGLGEWQVALRGAFILEQCWSKPSAAFLTEVRRVEAALGVTKGDRERLGYRGAAKPPAPGPAREPKPDPRLGAVT